MAHYYDTLLWRTACCTGPFNQTNRWSVAHHHPSWPTTVFQERKKTLQLVLERERSDLSVTESSMCVTIMSFTCVTITWKALNLCHSCRVVTYLYIIIYIYIYVHIIYVIIYLKTPNSEVPYGSPLWSPTYSHSLRRAGRAKRDEDYTHVEGRSFLRFSSLEKESCIKPVADILWMEEIRLPRWGW